MKAFWKFWRRKQITRETDESARAAKSGVIDQKKLAELFCRSAKDVIGMQQLIGNQALLRLLALEDSGRTQEGCERTSNS